MNGLWLALACAPVRPPPAAAVQDTAAPEAQLIYFVLVDRVANGDPGNDQASPGPAVDRSDPQAWHGGDLRGVLDHLDDIQALGATTLWLSPVFATRTEPIGPWGAFHGYWQWDPSTVEPRFGTTQELVALADALRSRRMGLLLDLVTNHVGYGAPIEQAHPDWFHDTPSIEDWQDPLQLETWRVHGLPDLAQEKPEVAAWLTEVATGWQRRLGHAGYRVDAVRHVPNSFLAALGAAVREVDPGAWWLGEDFTGDVGALAESQRTGGFSHVFDFPLHYAMTEVFCDDAPPARLAAVLGQDPRYVRPEGLVTFLDNHDLPRIRTRCHGDEGRLSRALAFLLSTRGVPALTWGTEAGLEGAEEPHNRGDMRFLPTPLGESIAMLARVRADHPALRGGAQSVVQLDADSAVVARVQGEEAALIAVNRGASPRAVALPDALTGMRLVHHLDQGGTGPLSSTALPEGVAWGEQPALVPAHGLAVWILRGEPRPWPEGRVTLTVRVQGAPPLPEGAALRLVGGDPALGGWDSAHGLPLSCDPVACTGALSLPRLSVLEGKPVVVEADGATTWASGENRAVLVEADTTWAVAW